MPRRKGKEAEAVTIRLAEARWRCLLRNPEFRSDLGELLRLRSAAWPSSPNLYRKRRELCEKWNFEHIPYTLCNWPPTPATDLPEPDVSNLLRYEALFDPEETAPVQVLGYWDAEYLDAEALDDPKRLFLAIDLDYPHDVLLSLIEEKLRQAREDEGRRTRRRDEAAPRKRRRLDKIDFQLRVYDLAVQGEKFTAIAKALRRPLPTIKSAFLAARLNIYGVAAPAPGKRELPLAGFDRERHLQACSVCSAAETFEEMCPQARAYASQDYVGSRERLLSDEDRDALEHGIERRKQGRKASR